MASVYAGCRFFTRGIERITINKRSEQDTILPNAFSGGSYSEHSQLVTPVVYSAFIVYE
jgi:hypothetical protein